MPGLMVVKSAEDLNREEAEENLGRLQAAEDLENRDAVESSLAGHIRKVWERNYRYKRPIEQRMLETVRRIGGRYSETKLSELRDQGLPAIYMQLVSVKTRAAKSWIRDVLMPAGDRPWTLKPTKEPSLSPEQQAGIEQRVMHDAQEFMQATGQQISQAMMMDVAKKFGDKIKQMQRMEAETRTERMAGVIEDQLIEGGWEREFDDVISDVVDFPAGILKSPVMYSKRRLSWGDGGEMSVEREIHPFNQRVDPFNFYPSPGCVDPQDGDMIEIIPRDPESLYDLIGLPGYDEDKIRDAIDAYRQHGTVDIHRDGLKSRLRSARGEENSTRNDDGVIETIQFWGSVTGSMLLEWGVSERRVPDPDETYDIMAEMVGPYVICVRFNPDPLGRKPYSKACFENVPGSFWGNGVPDLICDCEDVCNASARALVANMGIASGPQVAVNTESIPAGTDIKTIFPWKIWQLDFAKTGSGSRPPIDFFQPNPMTESLLKTFEHFSRLADEYSGIPAYTYGSSANMGGAARTASGLSMLMNAASKAIKNVIKHIDSGIITPTIGRYYVHNMLWHPDPEIKGDAQIIARGALSLVAKEQNQMRLQELLAQTANPIDMEIIGLDGRANMLRQAVQGVDLGGDDVIPDQEEIKMKLQQMAMQQQMQAQQQPPQGGAPREANPAGQPMGGGSM